MFSIAGKARKSPEDIGGNKLLAHRMCLYKLNQLGYWYSHLVTGSKLNFIIHQNYHPHYISLANISYMKVGLESMDRLQPKE